MGLLYVFITIIFTVYGQLILKWQIAKAGEFPDGNLEKLIFLFHLLLNPWIISSFFAAFLAAISWMIAVSELPLSYAYPFTTLSIVLVLFCSIIIFKEPITTFKILGAIFVILGLIMVSRG